MPATKLGVNVKIARNKHLPSKGYCISHDRFWQNQQKARTLSKFWDLNIILNGDCFLSNGPIFLRLKSIPFKLASSFDLTKGIMTLYS